VIAGFWSMLGDGARWPGVSNVSQVSFDLAYDPGLFPSLSACSCRRCSFVQFPTAFRKDPAVATSRLDKENSRLVCRQGHDAGHQSLALGTIALVIRATAGGHGQFFGHGYEPAGQGSSRRPAQRKDFYASWLFWPICGKSECAKRR